MIIKLQDGDILTAKDDPDYEGVIHVPDTIWNHIIKEVEHPEQSFFNSLYLDVKDLEIGGSGLPVVIHKFKIGTNYSGNVYEINHKPSGQTLSIQVPVSYCVFFVVPKTVHNEIYYFVNNSSSTKTYTIGTDEQYYYVTPNIVSVNSPKLIFLDENDNEIVGMFDNVYNDQSSSSMFVNKNVIDFLWLTP